MSPWIPFAAGVLAGAAAAGLAARLVLARRRALYGRLFSFAMHELNTPVTAVNMTVMNLLEGVFGELPASQRPWIEMTREQIGRLNALVGEIRDLVHMELHEELRLNEGEAAPADLVREATAALRQGFALAGVELKLEAPPGLPAVKVDPERAARCLTSLLLHARKFRKGGAVSLSARGEPGAVEFVVGYDGPALPPGEPEASLDLFYPARSRKDQQLAATGLGLGLVAAVARRAGGELSFSVEPSGRSRLALRLPAGA